jgi:LuxR family transcriptional regulator, maltose regulon positive regulatory protein
LSPLGPRRETCNFIPVPLIPPQTCVVTLHRLRQLLGDTRIILFGEGLVTINPKLCWVDTWAFARLYGVAKPILRSGGADAAVILAGKRAVALYSGDFLATDTAHSWAIPLRGVLRSRVLQIVIALGRHWEEHEAWQTAVNLYLQGLEVDELVEELYQQLMVCHGNRGDHGSVQSVYNRCRLALAGQGITPSATTKAVYETSIKNGL